MEPLPPAILRLPQRFLLGHVPLLLAATAVVCAALAPVALLWSIALAVAIAVLMVWWVGWQRGVITLLAGLASAASMQVRTTEGGRARAALLEAGTSDVVARVEQDGIGSARSWTAVATLVAGGRPGTRVLWRGTGLLPIAGTRLEARGDFSLPDPPRNPGEMDRQKWMESLGIAVVFRPLGPAKAEVPGWARWSAKIRHGFSAAVVHGLDEASLEAQVIRAMVIGERPQDADAVMEDFRNSGALHVFSVSGMHVAMVGTIGWFVLAAIGISRRQAVALLMPIMFGYALLTGFEPPAARAAWMAAVFFGAFLLRRKPDLLNSLGTVLLISTLWDGRLLYQPGVQLSYGVVAAIAVGMTPAARCFQWIARTDPYLPASERGRMRVALDQARQWLANSLSVSLAAGIGSTPLTMIHFGIVTPVSLVANLVVLPLVTAILSLALFSAVTYSFAPAVSAVGNRANAWVASVSMQAIGMLAGLPGGHFTTRRPDTPSLVVHDLPYGAMSSVLTDSRGRGILFDCGGSDSFRWSVLPSLRRQGIAPDTVILSHPDGAHLGGGYPVWQMLPLRRAILPVTVARSQAFEAWNQRARRDGIAIHLASIVERLDGPDGSTWHRLYAPPFASAQTLADDRVSVWLLEWRGWRFLFLSDAGYHTEQALLGLGVDLSAEVIIAGKHRKDVSLGEELLTAVKPRVIVGKNPDYPPEESHAQVVVDSWRNLGIRFIDQEESGAVTITIGEDRSLRLTGFLTPDRPLVLPGR